MPWNHGQSCTGFFQLGNAALHAGLVPITLSAGVCYMWRLNFGDRRNHKFCSFVDGTLQFYHTASFRTLWGKQLSPVALLCAFLSRLPCGQYDEDALRQPFWFISKLWSCTSAIFWMTEMLQFNHKIVGLLDDEIKHDFDFSKQNKTLEF